MNTVVRCTIPHHILLYKTSPFLRIVPQCLIDRVDKITETHTHNTNQPHSTVQKLNIMTFRYIAQMLFYTALVSARWT